VRPRSRALIKAIIILPGTTLVFIPVLLVYLEGGPDIGWGEQERWAVIAAGGLLIALGAAMAAHTVGLFFTHGQGTPAPWEPPRRLVIRGAYRHVRNPMITSVLCMLIGESLVLGSRYILAWAGVFFVLNHLYFVLSEEPGLQRRFGDEYLEYKSKVPRWIPRLRPYRNP
jgi:protein-S-isoprenylcysteine O-methyltransferase Ste14